MTPTFSSSEPASIRAGRGGQVGLTDCGVALGRGAFMVGSLRPEG